MKKWKFNDSGFSLVEIMVAVGMVGALSLVVMTLKKDTATSTKRLEIASEIVTLHNAIGQILLDEAACTNTLSGRDVTGAVAVPNVVTAGGANLYSVGSTYGNGTVLLQAATAQIVGGTKTAITAEPGKSRANVRMRFNYRRVSALITGNTDLQREIIVSAKMNTASEVVESCYSTEGDAIQEAMKKSCEAIEGTYDAANEKCDLKHYHVGSSDLNSAAVSRDWIRHWQALAIGNGTGTPWTSVMWIGDSNVYDRVVFNSHLHINGYVQLKNDLTIMNEGTISMQSDKRLKKNIYVLENVLDSIDEISGVSFDWIGSGKTDIGFVAQEIQKVYPELVREDNDGMLTVKYPQMTAVAIQGIKELMQENRKLRAENRVLKVRVHRLETELERVSKYLCAKDKNFCQ